MAHQLDVPVAEGPSGESAGSLDEIISRLQGVAPDLQAVREGKTGAG